MDLANGAVPPPSAAARSVTAFALPTVACRKPKSNASHDTSVPTAEPQTLLDELLP